jgi:hypothetical protein
MSPIKDLGKTYKLAEGEITRVELDDEHYYFIDGEFCISVTKVLDIAAPFPEGLRAYLRNTSADESSELLKMTADRGSKLHDALERLLNAVELDKEEYPTTYEREALRSFIRTMKFLQPANIQTELIVADKAMRLGGTMDMVAEADLKRLEYLLEPTKYLDIDPETDTFIVKPKFLDEFMAKPINMVCFVWDHKFTGRSTYNHKVQASKYKNMYRKSYPDKTQPTLAFTWRYSSAHKNRFQLNKADLPEKSFDRIYDTCLEYLEYQSPTKWTGFPEPPEMIVYPDKFRLFEAA